MSSDVIYLPMPEGWGLQRNCAGQNWDLFDGVNVIPNLSTMEVQHRILRHHKEQEKVNGQYRQAGQTSRDTTAAQPAAGDAGGTAPDLTSSYTFATNSYTSAAQAASQTGVSQLGRALYTNPAIQAAHQAQVLAAYQVSQLQLFVPTVTAPPQIIEPPEIIELPRAAPAVGELVGYRCWRNHGDTLLSVTASTPWPPHCPMRDITAAGAKISDFNGAGVWAFRSPFRCGAQFQPGSGHNVYGSIWMWGTVIEHEDGYRAEYATIRSLDDAEINLERLRDRYLKK